jgi:adenosylmethionine-8-amino-7-oxononanoate aminotransferase
MTDIHQQKLIERDQNVLWHPYASATHHEQLHVVNSAEGVYLHLADGRHVIDGMSSWWAAIHGYNHPVLNTAVEKQIKKMSHVMFGGLTHEPAIQLAEKLVAITPAGLNRVFFSDSGSVSVEVAIKMAIQYWQALGKSQKHKLLTIRGGYHGDTFATMAVCDPVNGMHHLFSNVLPQHIFSERPGCRIDEKYHEDSINDFRQQIENHHDQIAAVILEPVVQGAGGMYFYHPQFLTAVRELCNTYNVLLIADEIATGFGRSGKLFACEHANITPDILCLGKALTGGYMTLAATLCNDEIAEIICSGEAKAFMHGPTFMANPLACAVANASLDTLFSQNWQQLISDIENGLKTGLANAKHSDKVADVRVLGAIGVIEMKNPIDKEKAQILLIERGVWLRPFGKLLYTMPPYITTETQLQTITQSMCEVVTQL